jgi:phosphoglycerol transferase MdoB-like AlkP superfamily enzyme
MPGNLSQARNPWPQLRPFAWVAIAGLLALTLARVGLASWQAGRVGAVHGWAAVFVGGLRVDIATLSMLLVLPLLAWLLLPPLRIVRGTVHAWLVLVAMLLVFMEVATPPFMTEYGLRPNRLFLEYLVYPMEVGATLVRGHLASTVAGILALLVTGCLAWRWLRAPLRTQARLAWPVRLATAVAMLLLAAMGARSTLGHRALNPAMVAFSSDPTVNELPLNSTYSVLYAAKEWLTESDGAEMYGKMPWPQVLQEVRAQTGLPASAFTDPRIPTLAARTPAWRGQPRNLVIILEESLGAQFVGSLGGLPLTPNIDALGKEGWKFEHLYATGTRSVRGIEAVLTGFTPTPAEAVVKQPLSQGDFFTIARVLSRRGYDATFYYGGESHFDNMRGFFLDNGFTRIIEQKDFKDPAFVGSWGVSDEDLVRRADREFRALHEAGKPFFGLVFSSSNHDPFEYPDGRIQPYDQPRQTRNNAAKYADYAIGEFFRLAKASPYWRDTVFLVVADHDSRVFGKNLVPIANFHIPAIVLGAGVVPRSDRRIVSQVDLPPTLLSLLGIGDPTPMVGRDLTDLSALVPGRAMMQYDRNFAWMQGDKVAILTPGGGGTWHWDAHAGTLSPLPADPALQHIALAMALWGTEAYRRKLYAPGPKVADDGSAGR